MEKQNQKHPLPEKVLRRHSELLEDLVPHFAALVFQDGRPADVLLNQHLRTHRELGSRDRRFLSQALFSYFRWYGWAVRQLHLAPAEACLLGAALDSTELHQSFQYIQQHGNLPNELVPIGERSLEDKCSVLNNWFRTTLEHRMLTPADLVPVEFIQSVNAEVVLGCIEQFQQRPPTWLRTRVDAQLFSDLSSKQGIVVHPHPLLPRTLQTKGGKALEHTLNKQASTFCVQDLSSQCVGIVCAPAANEEWWDCCAGAGGKSLHLMDLMEQKGRVLASDIRTGILKELKKRTHRYGIRNIHTQTFNAASDLSFRRMFDGVLVDAPCSGWGTWGRNPDARWRIATNETAKCATRQIKILRNASHNVKPGGVLVYSVCTLTESETLEVVLEFLKTNADFQLEPFPHPLTEKQTDGRLQIWPWDGPGDAMFIARFRNIRKG